MGPHSKVADAMKWCFRARGCRGALINGGFVRQDRSYPAESVLPLGRLGAGALGQEAVADQGGDALQQEHRVAEAQRPTPPARLRKHMGHMGV